MTTLTGDPSGEATNGSKNDSSENSWSEDRLAKFWMAMRQLYGKRWTSEYGPEITPVWRAELQSMTPAEAALGWKACKASGDAFPPTLPQFVRRVSDAIKANVRPEAHRALPEPQAERDRRLTTGKEQMERIEERLDMPTPGTKAALEGSFAVGQKAEPVDAARLSRALGGAPVTTTWPRRVLLRPAGHPAGRFTQDDLAKAQVQAQREGRSTLDLTLELLAYNGWSPDDEETVRAHLQLVRPQLLTEHDGATPFVDAWRTSA